MKWYGSRPDAAERAREKQLLTRYRQSIKGKKGSGVFDPKEEGPYGKLYHREVEIISRRINPGDSVLDVGAGYGRLVKAALVNGAESVVALEPDQIAVKELEKRFGKRIQVVKGFAQKMDFADRSFDIVAFVGNSLGMMWSFEDGELVCQQKEALLEMVRVAEREVSFIVYGKETLESSLKAYEPLARNIVDIRDGLMFVEEGERKPYNITGEQVERFVFQKFGRGYLENLLKDAGIADYSIKGVPEGTEYGYLVVIKV